MFSYKQIKTIRICSHDTQLQKLIFSRKERQHPFARKWLLFLEPRKLYVFHQALMQMVCNFSSLQMEQACAASGFGIRLSQNANSTWRLNAKEQLSWKSSYAATVLSQQHTVFLPGRRIAKLASFFVFVYCVPLNNISLVPVTCPAKALYKQDRHTCWIKFVE